MFAKNRGEEMTYQAGYEDGFKDASKAQDGWTRVVETDAWGDRRTTYTSDGETVGRTGRAWWRYDDEGMWSCMWPTARDAKARKEAACIRPGCDHGYKYSSRGNL